MSIESDFKSWQLQHHPSARTHTLRILRSAFYAGFATANETTIRQQHALLREAKTPIEKVKSHDVANRPRLVRFAGDNRVHDRKYREAYVSESRT